MKKTILVVEDEEPLRQALCIKLGLAGFTTLEGKNGEEGLSAALSKHPDLILLDLLMPVMDGLTMLKQLRLDDWGKDAKVIILTNVNEVQKVSEALMEHAFDYLIKSDEKIENVVLKVQQKLAS